MGIVFDFKPRKAKPDPQRAYELYLKASELDEDLETMAEAEQLYQRAIYLDPSLAIAYTNLGNIRFRWHDPEEAEVLYRKALEIDKRQPEALYNIGYLLLEGEKAEESIPMFERAIAADIRFANAYFNLAMALEQLGRADDARPHWRKYVELEPSGTWTEIARRHLEA